MNDEIIVLSEIEAVRTNPSMYIGSVSNDGAHHLLLELVHNAVDEAILGTATKIEVTVGPDYCSVQDNGRGIPTTMNTQFNLSNLELVLTRLHSGSKFKKSSGLYTTGLHGVGLSCVNALSSELKIEVINASGLHSQNYREGHPAQRLSQTSDFPVWGEHGTKITFQPDNKIFKEFVAFDFSSVFNSIEELAYLNPNITFRLNSKKDSYSFDSSKGIAGILDKELALTQKIFAEPVHLHFQQEGLLFDCILNWTTENATLIKSYVNGVSTFLGGTHVNSFRSGVRMGLRALIADHYATQWHGEELQIEEALDGVIGVVNCKLSHPHFEGQTKSRLTNFEVVDPIEKEVSHQVINYFKKNSKDLMIVFERLQALRKTRSNAKRVAERIFLQYGTKKINEEVYQKQFGERSKTWHSSAVWITDQDLLKAHADHFETNEEALALDVCCGSGVVGASFKHKVKKVIGLDLTPEMINLSKTRLDEVHQGNVYNIPFSENKFDLVCTREVLHLLPYPEKPVSEIYRVLKPGGQFVVGQILPFSEVDAAWVYRIFKKKQPLFYNLFQEEDFKNMLLGAGFVDLVMTEMNVWENIDVWINSYETTALHRHEIREIYQNASEEIRKIHPFKILPNGEIHDLWRWCIFSVKKPL